MEGGATRITPALGLDSGELYPPKDSPKECHENRSIAGYIPRLPAGIESAWHRHLNTDSFSFGTPRLPDLLPMVASVTAIRLLNGATTQEERDAAATLLREAADCVDQHEITREEAFRHLMVAAVSKQMNLSPADADRFVHQVTHIQ